MQIINLTIDIAGFLLMFVLLAVANKPFTLKPIRAEETGRPERRKSFT